MIEQITSKAKWIRKFPIFDMAAMLWRHVVIKTDNDPGLFADDTSIFYSHSDPNCLESVLNNELCNLDIWLKCNMLSINVKKTNYIIFKSRQKKLSKSFSLSFG